MVVVVVVVGFWERRINRCDRERAKRGDGGCNRVGRWRRLAVNDGRRWGKTEGTIGGGFDEL